EHALAGILADISSQKIAGDAIPGADFGDPRQRRNQRLDDLDLGIGKTAGLPCRPGREMHLATREMQRRHNVIGDAFVAQVVQDRVVYHAVWMGESPPKGLAGIAYVYHRTVEKSPTLEQFETAVGDHCAGLRMPNEPASDDFRMQCAHEHSYAPQRQSGC